MQTTLISLASVITALGGFELVKYLLNRRANSAIASSDARRHEFDLSCEVIRFCQEQMRSSSEWERQQAQRIRELTDEVARLTREKALIENELALKRCERRGCPNREPQNGF